jgi:hypothetical protein
MARRLESDGHVSLLAAAAAGGVLVEGSDNTSAPSGQPHPLPNRRGARAPCHRTRKQRSRKPSQRRQPLNTFNNPMRTRPQKGCRGPKMARGRWPGLRVGPRPADRRHARPDLFFGTRSIVGHRAGTRQQRGQPCAMPNLRMAAGRQWSPLRQRRRPPRRRELARRARPRGGIARPWRVGRSRRQTTRYRECRTYRSQTTITVAVMPRGGGRSRPPSPG